MTRRRRPQSELRRFRRDLVALLRDSNASAPAVVKTAGARSKPPQHEGAKQR